MNKFDKVIFKAQVLRELADKITWYEKYWLTLEWTDAESNNGEVLTGDPEEMEKYEICEELRKQIEKML